MNTDPQAKQIAVVSYLTIIGTIAALFMNTEPRRPFASFHIRQSLGLGITFYLLGYFIGYFDSWLVTSAFWVFFFVLWLYGFASALQGTTREVPIVGKYFQQWFKNL